MCQPAPLPSGGGAALKSLMDKEQAFALARQYAEWELAEYG
jgi:hypothetical protein